MRLWFVKAPNGAARDFNWHHVLGIWAAIPLFIIICSGAVFGYSWASDLVYRLAGETPPVRGPAVNGGVKNSGEVPAEFKSTLPLAALVSIADEQVQDWQNLMVTLPKETDPLVNISLDAGNGGQPQRRKTVVVDRQKGELNSVESFADLSTGRQWRSLLRFLHTGEALGIVGQTIAGLSCLAAIFMVWTGLALACRRLSRSVKRRRVAR